MPQFNYDRPLLQLGQFGTASPWTVDSYINELLAQQSTLTAGGVATAGTYTLEIVAPEGTFSVDVVAVGGESTAVLLGAIEAAILADPDFLNILVPSLADPVLTLDFIHPGIAYALTMISNPGANITIATAQAPGGTFLPIGVGLVPGSGDGFATLPGAATVDADFLGVFVCGVVDVQVATGVAPDPNGVAAGNCLSAMSMGDTVVSVEDAVAFNGQVFMRTQNPGLNQAVGNFRSDADGGDAIALTGIRFRSVTTGPGLARVSINRV